MVQVYIGNATRQTLHFSYRLPERKPIREIIPWGKQIKLTVDCSSFDIDAINTQWGKYGLVSIDEMESARKKRTFQGWLISIGKQIPEATMKKAAIYRQEVLDAVGQKFREEAALVMINTIEQETGAIAKNYEISVAEIEPSKGFANPDDTHIAEGFRADRDQRNLPEPPPEPRRRRRAA